MFWHKIPQEKAFFKSVKRLRIVVGRLRVNRSKKVRRDPLAQIQPVASSFFDMAAVAERSYKRSGCIGWWSLVSLRQRYESLRFALDSDPVFSAGARNRKQLSKAMAEGAKSLDALRSSILWEITRSVRARKSDQDILRESVATMDKGLAEKLGVEELEYWASCGPFTDFENPQQVLQLARLLVLDQVPDQVWEVRCRTRTPVRRLQLVGFWGGLPSLEELRRIGRENKAREMIVAARKPSWRIAWVEKAAGR